MLIADMKVMVVETGDYKNQIRSLYGLDPKEVSKADLIIDRHSGKILKSRYFHPGAINA